MNKFLNVVKYELTNKEKIDRANRELAAHEAKLKERNSIPYLKKKLEEAKEKANSIKIPNFR